MIRKKKITSRVRLLSVLFLTCSLQTSYSQSENSAFRNLTTANGLPSLSVTSVTQDIFGFIWIGTWDGDYKYDGRSFKKIPNTIDGRFVKADEKGGVWISFEYSVGYYDPSADSVKRYSIDTKDRFPQVEIDKAGNVWTTSTKGVFKFDPKTSLFIREANQRPGIIWSLNAGNDGELLFIYSDSIQPLIGRRNKQGVYSYEQFPEDLNNPKKGTPFYLTEPFVIRKMDTGILIINKIGWAYQNTVDRNWIFKKPMNKNFSLSAEDAKLDNYGNFWLNQLGAISKINITTGKVSVYKSDPRNPKDLLSLAFVGMGGEMFFDKQGVLWIPSYSKGISRLNLFESDFGLLKDSTGLPITDVLSALESKDGTFWIGSRTSNNGLIHYSADGKIIKSYGASSFYSPAGKTVSNELSHPFPWSLAETNDGSVWVGTGSPPPRTGGLNRIRPGNSQVTRFKHDPNDSLSLINDWVYRLFVDGSGKLWLGTRDGVSSMDPYTEKITRHADYDFLEMVTFSGDMIVRDYRRKKTFLINHKTLEEKPFGIGFTSEDSLHYVHEDDAGKIWFITDKSFGYLDPTFKKIAWSFDLNKKGFPADEVTELNSDKKGNIWLGTDNGIFQFDPVTEKFKHFGFERGLQGNYFNNFYSYKGPSGKIYFSGAGGVNIFDPASIHNNPYPPQMIFTAVKLDEKQVTAGKGAPIQKPIFMADKITVEPDVLTISIDFTAIHFANYESNTYEYKLEGFDKNWRDGSTSGNATYTNLSPGTYTLYIRGSNWDGVWSDKKSIQIIILPPWWRTWWAYTLYAVVFLLLMWRLYQYQKAKTIRKEREKTREREFMQAKEIEKAYHELKATQQQLIQSEKMASLGELTAGIAHEIQNPLNFVNNFSEVNDELLKELKTEAEKGNLEEVKAIAKDIEFNSEKINHHGKRADAIVKGMLQHSRNSSGQKEPTDINELADEYLRLSYHGLRAKDKTFNATIKTEFDNNIGKVNVNPQDIGRVILNLVNNAFYAVNEKQRQNLNGYEPTVIVSTRKEKDKIEIKVKDNGNGIPQKVLDKIFQPFFTTKPTGQGTGLGLSLSYDIVKTHGGELKVETKEGEGSVFSLLLPV